VCLIDDECLAGFAIAEAVETHHAFQLIDFGWSDAIGAVKLGDEKPVRAHARDDPRQSGLACATRATDPKGFSAPTGLQRQPDLPDSLVLSQYLVKRLRSVFLVEIHGSPPQFRM